MTIREILEELGTEFNTSVHHVTIDRDNEIITLQDRINIGHKLIIKNSPDEIMGNHFNMLMLVMERTKEEYGCTWKQAFLLTVYDNEYFIFKE